MTNKFNRLEKKEAARDGATLQPNSGRGVNKGDAKLKKFLIDYKFNRASFQLTLKNWQKHKKDAWHESGREPVIIVKFDDGTKLAIIDFYNVEELLNE